MTLSIRTILVLMLLSPVTTGLLAQQTSGESVVADEAISSAPAETATAEETPETAGGRSNYEIRNMFSERLRRHPQEVGRILALDPTLLSNESYLARYPELARFVATHPEIQRNPHFYLADFREHRRSGMFEEILEVLIVSATILLIAFAFAWLIRTIIEQKRWNRLSRTQSEVHNKILDRFGTTGELLEYIKSPAGTKFLESAPIPLHVEKTSQPQNAPLNRIIWSVQLGVVVAVAALGLLLVSFRLDPEPAEAFFAMGVIAFCVGAGFIASAIVSLVLSRRLSRWQESASSSAFDEAEGMR